MKCKDGGKRNDPKLMHATNFRSTICHNRHRIDICESSNESIAPYMLKKAEQHLKNRAQHLHA